ncbi:hypothetical protein [Sphingobacterium sp. UDSM-2020]|uniref:hypothetical protein n=1 Tax=Sphingobacterium sp. UDSM-2020 TaxID=2795738 RepID=UPI001937399D|nr:hypothetical protein [Sphingobacterium sp. UDSM-2020]QQD14267.1 hypothetical protein JAZ75_01590 [Sphingobacterium sp. UDSM-2020]
MKIKKRIYSIQKKALKKRRKRKAYTISRNKRKNSPSGRIRKFKYSKQNYRSIDWSPVERRVKLIVPQDFSLISNLDSVLKFFENCKKYNSSICNVVFFDFHEVQNIGSGAITILLSICGWLNDQKIYIEGNYPEDHTVRTRFEKLGFLKYFRANYLSKLNSKSRSEIVQRGINTTNPILTARKIRDAMETVTGQQTKNTKIQGMLIELMANTVNHAYEKHQKGWYLSLDHNEIENKVHFCFVDNGGGILNTIKIRSKERIIKFLGLTDDGNLLKMAFDGKFGSRTKLTYRGRGLPLVKNNFEDGYIKNLIVISNGVYYNFEKQSYQILDTEFEGTFYFWELNNDCKLIKYGN